MRSRFLTSFGLTRRAFSISNQKSTMESTPEALDLLLRPYDEQFLAIFDRLAIDRQLLDDLPGNIRFNFVKQFHGFDNAEHLPNFNHVTRFHERWSSR